MSSWTPVAILNRYITSHRCSIGFTSGKCDRQSVAAMPSSSGNRSEDFIPVPKSSQGTVGLCDPPRIFIPRPSLTHHIKYTTASPDSFTPVTWLSMELAFICKEMRAAVVDLPNSGECQWRCKVLRCEHRSH